MDFIQQEDRDSGYFPEGAEHREVLTTMGNRDFVWDDAKNKHNLKVHHVDFETAMFVFNDKDRIEIYDESYCVNSTGHLAKFEEYDPSKMIIKTLSPDMRLTEQQIEMLEKADKMPITYESDCPELTPQMAEAFKHAAEARDARKSQAAS